VNKVGTYGDLRNVLMKRIFLSALHFRINTRYKVGWTIMNQLIANSGHYYSVQVVMSLQLISLVYFPCIRVAPLCAFY
jgi:hypothetical protein